MEGTTSTPGSMSQVGLPRLVSYTKPCHCQGHTPGQWNHEERVKGKVKGSWRPPELPEAPGGPATLHCASLLSSLILLPPKSALAWKQDTEQISAQWPSGLASEPRCSLCTGHNFSLRRLLSSGLAQRTCQFSGMFHAKKWAPAKRN